MTHRICGVDLDALTRAHRILTFQAAKAEDAVEARRLKKAADDVRMSLRRLRMIEAGTVTRISHIPVPDDLLREMLRSGRDTWIVDLLGCGRQAVRDARIRLGVPSHQRGGRTEERHLQHTLWEGMWRARLAQAGYLRSTA